MTQSASSYAIECNPHYYSGDIFRRNRSFLVRGNDERIIVLGSHKDAESVCKLLAYWEGVYYLDHNQYSRPSHKVVKYRGQEQAISIVQAARKLDYGYSDDGDEFTADQLRTKIERIIVAAV